MAVGAAAAGVGSCCSRVLGRVSECVALCSVAGGCLMVRPGGLPLPVVGALAAVTGCVCVLWVGLSGGSGLHATVWW